VQISASCTYSNVVVAEVEVSATVVDAADVADASADVDYAAADIATAAQVITGDRRLTWIGNLFPLLPAQCASYPQLQFMEPGWSG
jgi:hypothetical protein